jgi:hypothetical protein
MPDQRAGSTGFDADVASRDWDAIAAELGMPEDWREQGYDAPEYMEREDSVYRLMARPGSMRCPYPTCSFTTRRGTETMFRHAHRKDGHGRTR